MVQIRDMDSHRTLPGVEVGDIGPKFGFQAKDNGYAIFTGLTTPRENILKRYIQVSPEGKVTRTGNPLVLYSIMMLTRIQVMTLTNIYLSQSLTIAIRYGIVRTQFMNREEGGKVVERKLMDYQTHQSRVIESLADCYVINLAMRQVGAVYEKMINNI